MTLITKYRPDNFADVIGQGPVIASLKKVLDKGNSRTFLFSGPSGTGKTTLARIAAKQVGCNPKDIQEIDAATFTGIDDMRQITGALSNKPLMGGEAKAIILDEAHALSKNAFQSLLKSLEEPPPWVWWFLCTTDPAKVPANIQTRCTKFDLKPVPDADLESLLFGIAEAEKVNPPEGVVGLCVAEAQGSPRAALSNLAACIGAKTKAEAAALLKTAVGSAEAVELARALVKGTSWGAVREILAVLKEQSPESVRHVVRAYVTAVIMGGKASPSMFAVLEAFSQPFPSTDGISPLVLACGKLLFD